VTTGARRRAREVAFRVAYQADVSGETYRAAWERRRGEERLSEDQLELVDDVIGALDGRGSEIDGWIQDAAERWRLDRLSLTDRAVLRSAAGELASRAGTPARVVIDEYVEIAKRFGSEDSGGFVNGVLDAIARRLRPGEW
jgi:N utilization substance protein B